MFGGTAEADIAAPRAARLITDRKPDLMIAAVSEKANAR
jgi:hypothetical protein